MNLANPLDRLDRLTEREREILSFVGRGLTLPEIADRLHRSQKTIQTHRLSIGKKLGVGNRVELARVAIQAGLAPLDHHGDGGHGTGPGAALRSQFPQSGPAWQALQAIDTILAASSGPAFFRELVGALATVLGVRAAGISELTDRGSKFRNLASWDDGKIEDENICDRQGTPCDRVLRRGELVIETGATTQYPRNLTLASLDAQAYMGVRLTGHGQPIGALWIAHTERIASQAEPLAILKICACRAEAELTRLRDLDAMRELAEQAAASDEVPPRKLTLRKRARRSLVAGIKGLTFESLVEQMPEGVGVIDTKEQHRYVNARYAEMFGRPADELLDKTPAEFMPPAEAAYFRSLTARRQAGSVGRYRSRFLRPDGSTVDVFISSRQVYDAAGTYLGSLALVSSIDAADA